MAKRLLSMALLLVLAFGLLSGCKEGWTEPVDPDDAGGDITLSGSMYNGKAVVTVVLHPDGTVDCDANGDKTEGTWEASSGDVAMVAHLTVKGETVDMDITDTGEGYSAEFPLVPGMILTGGKASAVPKDITLSGSMYNGKAVVTVVLHPDGTVDCDANGDKTEGTWEAGSGEVAMVAHFAVKGETVDMDITETEEGYSAEFPMVPGMILTGAKGSAAPAAKDITLSGSMYNGKAVVTVVLHPDGTVDCDANGDKTEGTWENGTGDVAMVAHLTVKGETVDMDITKADGGYSAEFPMVPGMILTGK